MEQRGGYYDKSGALRDMIQNHLLQLLCLIAMEPPVSLDADRIRDEKLKVLRALRPFEPHEALTQTVRGQYIRGGIGGAAGAGVHDGSRWAGGKPDGDVRCAEGGRRTWRWANVPFYLRTGKRLPQKVAEIVIRYRALPFSIFPPDAAEWTPNKLIIRLQPEEGMRLAMMNKEGPGGAAVADGAGYPV